LQIGERHVADEQSQPGSPWRYRSPQFGDRAVLDAGVGQLRVQSAASGTRRADNQPTQRTGKQRTQQQAPYGSTEGSPRRGDIGRLGDPRTSVRIPIDDHGVMELQVAVLLQARRHQQEFLRLQGIVEGNDEQLLAGR
jgi:hypothetical protein